MKKLITLLLVLTNSIFVSAQGNSQNKAKEKQKDKGKSEQVNKKSEGKTDISTHTKKIWEGTYTNEKDGPKPSKNQPAKVRQSFQRDYPNAYDVSWSKYRGDWTATFRNGVWISTAVYHANGDRRDTRTIVKKEDIPRKIFDIIINKRPESRIDDAVKIEVPKVVKDIFRVKNIIEGKAEFHYYDGDGVEVKYDY